MLLKETQEVIKLIKQQLSEKEKIIVAIDGRCASGKTTFASILQKHLSCNVIHLDDFFLRPEMRTPERLATPGGNADYERFLLEVAPYLKGDEPFEYYKFDCKTQTLGNKTKVEPCSVTIIEGSYSCHPMLFSYYDLSIFMDVEPGIQYERILKRSDLQKALQFKNKWIPLEEKYFSVFDVQSICDVYIKG